LLLKFYTCDGYFPSYFFNLLLSSSSSLAVQGRAGGGCTPPPPPLYPLAARSTPPQRKKSLPQHPEPASNAGLKEINQHLAKNAPSLIKFFAYVNPTYNQKMRIIRCIIFAKFFARKINIRKKIYGSGHRVLRSTMGITLINIFY